MDRGIADPAQIVEEIGRLARQHAIVSEQPQHGLEILARQDFQPMARGDEFGEQLRELAQLRRVSSAGRVKCPFGQRSKPGQAFVMGCQKGKVRRRLLHSPCREAAPEPQPLMRRSRLRHELTTTAIEQPRRSKA